MNKKGKAPARMAAGYEGLADSTLRNDSTAGGAEVAPFRGSIDRPPLIPPGEYEAAFLGFETRMMFRKATKIILWFQIVEPGRAFGAKLARYYNAKRLRNKQGKHGAFEVGFKSEFLREYALVFNAVPPRLDRIPMTCWENKMVRVKVITVYKDGKQRSIPEPLQYSVISEIKGLVQ